MANKNSKPRIGLACNALLIEGPNFPGLYRPYVNEDYVIAVEEAGGLPFLLPLVKSKETAQTLIENIDGLIITGGYDIHPQAYAEDPLPKLEQTLPRRDQNDLWLIEAARGLHLPILGICRGMQIINVAFGGSLYQDISYMGQGQLQHVQAMKPRSNLGHQITTEANSWIAAILGPEAQVNSFHHQAIKQMALDFRPTAWAKDGLIEAMEYKGSGIILGVEWHPEMMAADGDTLAQKLFSAFINLCTKAP